MEDIFGFPGEILKGFLRGIGYILAEIFFRIICCWIGRPLCKLITLGSYLKRNNGIYLDDGINSDFWCSFLGLMVVISGGIYYLVSFA